MISNSIGDRARAFTLQNASQRLKATLDVLTQELTSGQTADLGARSRGDLAPVHQFEYRIRQLQQFNQSNAELESHTGTVQAVLGALSSSNQQMATELRLTAPAPSPALVNARSQNAYATLETVVAQLNGTAAGVHMFAGTKTDTAPLVSAADMMGDLSALTAGLSDPADIELAVTAWFEAPAGAGGYVDNAYRGSVGATREVPISDTATATLSVDAAAPAVRNLLKGLAMASLITKGGLAISNVDQNKLLERSGETLMSNQSAVISLAATVGYTQKQIEQAQAANNNQVTSYEIARSKIVATDPFETAGALTEVQTQLEMLHMITARLSKLKLVDFLR